jgi:hypothetical protein
LLLGIGLAFVPIQGRPLDRWLLNFIRALFNPSQYVFHKENTQPNFFTVQTASHIPTVQKASSSTVNDHRLQQYLNQLPSTPGSNSPATPAPSFPVVSPEPTAAPIPVASPAPEPVQNIKPIAPEEPPKPVAEPPVTVHPSEPTQPVTSPSMPVSETLQSVQPIAEVKPLTETPTSPTPAAPPIHEVHAHVTKLYDENKKLREEIEAIKQSLQKQPEPTPVISSPQPIIPTPSPLPTPQQPIASLPEAPFSTTFQSPMTEQSQPATIPQPVTTPPVVTPPPPVVPAVPPKPSMPLQVPGLPQIPNIISGTVKDSKGEVLPNIIVEVKDAQGNPVRAFKTNKLGQFSAATSLANGEYTVELEDPRKISSFDVATVSLTGVQFTPLEITAKNNDVTQRDQLRQALFG